MSRCAGFSWRYLALMGLLACGESNGDSKSGPEVDGGGEDSGTPAPAESRADLKELLDLGIDKYVGAAEPSGSEELRGVTGIADGSIVYDFDPKDGPICLRGAKYNASVLDQGSENLMIFLQGGGACVTAICAASVEAGPRGVPLRGVMDVKDPLNPVASWNILYVPYCDGSVFGGDGEFTSPGDAMGKRNHYGQRNFSAALDLARKHFPNPRKVLLAGSSAGGWGTVYHRALVRSVYRNAELTVMNDAGIGFAVNNPAVADEWKATLHRPPSCTECQTHMHMTYFAKYMLEHDPDTIVGDFSSYGDMVIRRYTFTPDAETFKQVLLQETDILAKAHPDRYKRFFIQGESHTALQTGLHTTMVNGVTLAQWLGKMIARDPSWSELLQ